MKAMEAERWGEQDPRGYWMSEKLDGVRALWDGKVLRTKSGKRIAAPDWFTAGLPAGVWLDGELWLGRGRLQEMAGLLRRKGGDWSGVMLMVFDAPGNEEFEDRLAVLAGLDLPAHVALVEHVMCEGAAHFESFEQGLVDAGAEGVMMRERGSYYVCGRSARLLKVKRWQDDEAEVLEVARGKLVCRWAGKVVRVPTGGIDVGAVAGDLVTFVWCGFTEAGQPRNVALVGRRDYE